jgi:hypothetical protein
MSRLPDTAAAQRRANDQGDRIIKSYKVSSWLVTRVYGAVFLWFSWILWSEAWLAEDMMGYVARVMPREGLIGLLAVFGVLLAVPFLTPSTLRFRRTVGGGVIKAILLLILSGMIYILTTFLLNDDFLRFSNELRDVLPLMIKAVAGMAITGAVLVSLANALRDGEERKDDAPNKLSDADLRMLRRIREST